MDPNGRSDSPRGTSAGGDDLSWVAKQARAHVAVARAVRQGTLVRQPCEVCGAEPADAHHDDYDEPLNVRWLCRLHHRARHMQGGRKPVLGTLPFPTISVRALREVTPDEVVFISTRDEGIRETVAIWIPLWMVDEP